MATTVDTLLVRIQSDMSDLRKDLNRISAQTEQTASSMQKSFARVGSALAAVGGAAALGGLVKGFIATGAQVENLGVRFNTLFGSVEEGSKAFKVMASYASQVPFSLQDIQRGAAPLATVGKNAQQLGNLMKLTGNIAAASGMSFEEASQNVQRALTAGINSADMFRERGVSAMAGFQAGTTYSIDETVKKLHDAFGAGGQYDGITDQLAQTTDGAISMLGDSWFSFQRIVAESGLNDAFRDLINVVKGVVDAAKPLAVLIGAALGAAFRALAVAIKIVQDNMRSLTVAVGVFMALKLVTMVYDAAFNFIYLAKSIRAASLSMRFFNAVMKRTPLLLVAAALGFAADKMGMLDAAAESLGSMFENLLSEDVRKALGQFASGDLASVDKAISDTDATPLGSISTSDYGAGGTNAKDAAKALNELKQIIESTQDPSVKLKEDILAIEAALGSMSGAMRTDAVAALQVLKEKLRETEPMYKATKDAVISMGQGMSAAFADALVEGKNAMEALKNVFKSFVKTMIAKALELYVFNHIINAVFGLKGSAALPTATLGFRASGGRIQPNQPYVVGERGPELIVPSQSSTVMNGANTRSALGGGTTVVHQTINVSAGVSQTVRAEMMSLLPQFKQDTMSAVLDAKRRGGSFGQAFG